MIRKIIIITAILVMAVMANAAGRNEDARKYERLFEDIREVFQKEFVRPDGISQQMENGQL